MNIIHGVPCPSVITQRGGAYFTWLNDATGRWEFGNEVPAAIVRASPAREVYRWGNHVEMRRMRDRRGAA